MKREMTAGLVAACLALTLCACGTQTAADPAPEETTEAVTATAEETAEQPEQAEGTAEPVEEEAQEPEAPAQKNEADIDDCHVVITGYQIAEDYEGNPMIVVNYDFTNNSSENKTPIWTVYSKAFQDGVELEIAFGMDDSVYDAGIEQKELQPGASMTGCQQAFSLTSTSPVDFYAGSMFSQEDIHMVFDVE